MIELRVLGTLDLRDPDNGDLASVLARPKLVALLAYLAFARPKGFHSRETLLGLFWPESSQAKARGALNQSLYELRKALGEGALVSRGTEEVGLDPSRFWCDVEAFEAALEVEDREAALELYGGDLLPGFTLPGCDEFEAWLDERREGLQRRVLGVARARSEELAAAGEPVEATYWLRRALRWEPYDEEILRRLLVVLRDLGDRTGALREHAAFARRLEEELGVEPEAETRALVESIEAEREEGGHAPAPGPWREAVPEPILHAKADERDGAGWSHRLAFVAGGLAVAALLAVTSYRAFEGPERFVENGRVVIAELENRSGDPSLDPVGRMASAWIGQELLRTGLVQVVPMTAVLEETRRLQEEGVEGDDLVGALAAATGAGLVIHGGFVRREDALVFQIQILDVQASRLARSIRTTGSVEDPLTGVEDLGRRATGALATLVDDRLTRWADASSQPPSYEAYLAYTAGLDHFSRQEYAEAAASLSRAASMDSTFTAPLVLEALSYGYLMYEDNVELDYAQGARTDSLVALLEAWPEPLAPWDAAMLGYIAGMQRGDRKSAHRAMRRVVELGPDPRFQVDLARLALWRNFPDEALTTIAEVPWEAAEARGLTQGRRSIMATAHHRKGDYQAELALVEESRRRDPTYRGRGLELRARAGLRQDAEVDSLVREILAETSLSTALVSELEIHGYPELARTAVEANLEHHRKIPPDERDERWAQQEAGLLEAVGEPGRSRARVERLLAETPLSDNHVWYMGKLGVMAAEAGDREEALEYLHRIETMDLRPIFNGDIEAVVGYMRAQILVALGRKREAVEVLRRLVGEEKAVFYFPHFELIFGQFQALRGDPVYDAITAPRG